MDSITVWLSNHLNWFEIPQVSVTVTDIVEIIILSYLVYKVLLWVKNTKAWTLMKGILFLGVFIFIVYVLQMDTLVFLINRGINIVVMAGIVIFQPELRRALEQLGEKKIISAVFPIGLKEVTELYSDHTITELVKASMEMAKHKTGALIVIEKNVRLDEYERTGILLDSMISSQLLMNIFEHNTPLHDGAVIIQGNRIVAATCYLPLSDNMELSKELGTRHRAGVGISEVTDSLTIIVSEETGKVSLAHKGTLTRNVSAEMLRERLVEFQDKSVVPQKFRLWKGREKNEA